MLLWTNDVLKQLCQCDWEHLHILFKTIFYPIYRFSQQLFNLKKLDIIHFWDAYDSAGPNGNPSLSPPKSRQSTSFEPKIEQFLSSSINREHLVKWSQFFLHGVYQSRTVFSNFQAWTRESEVSLNMSKQKRTWVDRRQQKTCQDCVDFKKVRWNWTDLDSIRT